MTEFTLVKQNTGGYKEKSSNFHAISQSVFSIDHVKSAILILNEQFPDASHICYAYRIKKDKSLDEFCTDAGEPNGSAGLPILNVLKRNQIINSVIFVIRYFGGTKLGISGLVHAYKTSAENAIENTKLMPWFEKKRFLVTFPYKLEGIIKSILQKNQVEVIHEDFGEKIDIQLKIDAESADKFINIINELSAGTAQITIQE